MSSTDLAPINGAPGPPRAPDPADAISSDADAYGGPDPTHPSADPPDGDPNTSDGVVVTCTALTYSVRAKGGRELTLLRDVSLFLAPGTLTCILGPSGCGKTTLLDSLAGRKTYGTFSPGSRVRYDGRPASPAFLRRFVGYVEQFDTLLDVLTVEEMLMYTAELKHPRSETRAALRARVAALVAQLGLAACAGTVIGSKARRGVSGGEAKRVNIGIALINDPQVLFLDELTSGLDSFTGHAVVEAVRSVVQANGITCAASIHAPSPLTFSLFDRVAVLQRGRVVYFGGNEEAPLNYVIGRFPHLRGIRRAEGVADYLLDVTTRANADPEAAAALADGYAGSPLAEANRAEAEALERAAARRRGGTLGEAAGGSTVWQRMVSLGGGGTASGGDLEKGGISAPSAAAAAAERRGGTVNPWWWALLVLWRYRSLKSYRSPGWIAPRVGDKVMIVILVCTVWWGRGDTDPIAAAGILFLWSMLSAFTAMGSLPAVVLERPVYRRERADGLYNPAAYAFYKLSEELAPQVPAGLIYSALVFYLVQLQGSFLLFWLVYLVSTANAIGTTCLVSALSPNTSVAGALASSYATTLFFFSGYLIPFHSIPVYWRWYAVIDPLRYAFGSMAVNQFDGEGGLSPTNTIAGRSALSFYDLEGVDAWRWLGYLAIFFPVYATGLWAALRWLQHTKR